MSTFKQFAKRLEEKKKLSEPVMPGLFGLPIWLKLRQYAHFSNSVRGGRVAPRLNLLQLPEDLRVEALAVTVPCVSCGQPIHPLRARKKSERSRIAGSETESSGSSTRPPVRTRSTTAAGGPRPRSSTRVG